MTWPWRLNDTRPHGWYTAAGLTKFGPLPPREPAVEQTWPPRTLERDQQKTAVARAHLTQPWDEAREHFAAVVSSLEKAKT